ncbi:MAG TPA: hypothetical protein VL120_06325 [Solirubrobacteraceae bacterium]|nr:hypothetical protein [Solirubrobacteraceae bacterium]
MKRLLSDAAARAWLVVALVGAVVVVLVIALQLIPRLTGAQKLIDDADPALTDARVAGDRVGIDFISKLVDTADPLVTAQGGGAGEVGGLIGVVSRKTGLSSAQILAVLKQEAPHTTALLQALPLSDVTAERPGLITFLAKTLKLSENDTQGALKQSFPRLWQTLLAAPPVTDGWNDIPGLNGMTRFDGTTPVKSVPEVRDYFSKDLVAAVEANRADFQKVADKGGVGYIPWLLLVVGDVVLAFGLLMATRAATRPPGRGPWGVVVLVGVVILGLVLVLSYYPRLDAADKVITNLEPAFAKQRTAGDAAGIAMVHQIILFSDPLMTAKGGGSDEVPKLVKFVAGKTGLSSAAVLAALQKNAPKTTAVLQAIPLEAVSAEIPHLLDVLATTLKATKDEVQATLTSSTPGLAQTLNSVTPVTSGWDAIPGTERLTRFNGTPVTTATALDDYFREDVIPVLPRQRAHFDKLANTWPPVTYFPPLLMVVGLLVVLYGVFGMLVLSKKPEA